MGYWTTKLYNAIPQAVKELTSNAFKTEVKAFLINNAFYTLYITLILILTYYIEPVIDFNDIY